MGLVSPWCCFWTGTRGCWSLFAAVRWRWRCARTGRLVALCCGTKRRRPAPKHRRFPAAATSPETSASPGEQQQPVRGKNSYIQVNNSQEIFRKKNLEIWLSKVESFGFLKQKSLLLILIFDRYLLLFLLSTMAITGFCGKAYFKVH